MKSSDKGVSVLDAMSQTIMAHKAEKAAKGATTLTPVPGEATSQMIVAPGSMDQFPAAVVEAGKKLRQMILQAEQWVRELKALELSFNRADVANVLGPSSYGPLAAESTVDPKEQATAQKELEKIADEAYATPAGGAELAAVNAAADPESLADPGSETLADRMVRLQREAQAQTFGHADRIAVGSDRVAAEKQAMNAADGTAHEPVSGWLCPDHSQAVERVSARRKVTYLACPVAGCPKFEQR